MCVHPLPSQGPTTPKSNVTETQLYLHHLQCDWTDELIRDFIGVCSLPSRVSSAEVELHAALPLAAQMNTYWFGCRWTVGPIEWCVKHDERRTFDLLMHPTVPPICIQASMTITNMASVQLCCPGGSSASLQSGSSLRHQAAR